MDFYRKILVIVSTLIIRTSAGSPIIELPEYYDTASPWQQLATLGLTDLTETDCQRPCVVGDTPRVCLYTITLEYYAAMGTACKNCSNGVIEDCFAPQCVAVDGKERGVVTMNRMIPGPLIEACKNDLLVVNVDNRMEGAMATLHWHGMLQSDSPWMDGVPYVTQCPIGNTKFRYVFRAEISGTYFYHNHVGLHRSNGHTAPLIIYEPRSEEPWPSDTYNKDLREHIVFITDWMIHPAEMFYPGLPTLDPGILPTNFLINGIGKFLNGSDDDVYFDLSHPLATFHVEKNQTYRFRIINSNDMICPVLLQIEDHNMTLIAIDGSPIKPVIVDGLVSYAGERYDVVINTTNQYNKTSFWIHLRGLSVCETLNIYQYAVLSYGTNISDLGIIPTGTRPTIANPLPNNTIVNYPNTVCGASSKLLCITDLRSFKGSSIDQSIVTDEPDVRLFIPFGFRLYENVDDFHKSGNYRKYMNLNGAIIRSGMMNNVTYRSPSTPSLFLRDAENTELCFSNNLPADCTKNNENTIFRCDCPHAAIIEEDSVVEMILINSEDGINHPIHLHGYSFYVLYIGQDLNRTTGYTEEEIYEILTTSSSIYKSSNTRHSMPPLKDTITVPALGFVVIRFRADNPGDWMLHCHFEWHGVSGMMKIIRVLGEIVKPPPYFPICGDFDPLARW